MRHIVVMAAKKQKKTAYQLAKLTGITEPTLVNFLKERQHMRSDKLAIVMAVLGLEVRPKE